MPGPIAIDLTGRQPEVVWRLCSFRQVVDSEEEEGDDLAYEHVVAEHPELKEPPDRDSQAICCWRISAVLEKPLRFRHDVALVDVPTLGVVLPVAG